MGTVVTIDVYTADGVPGADLDARLAAAVARLHEADAVFSTWDPASPVSRLRRGEIDLGACPPEVAQVLEICAAARERTDGWFDPWAMPGGVDPTGYVKGWAAQRALAEFAGSDASGVLINAAGDIASAGLLPSGEPFRIGIADPFAPQRLAAVVRLTGAIATSGSYERGPHLIDPRTGQAGTRAASASVTGPDLGLADALATALAVAGEAGLDLLDRFDGYQGLVIGHDRSRAWTEHFPFAPRGG
ncbi:MAG: FAD:protein FMN transferase [Streptosporangiaceae bacterium]